jgi:hypothetical protein
MKIDMSPQAISMRMERVSQLREVCLALAGPRLKRPWGVPPSGDVRFALKGEHTRPAKQP